MSNQPRKFAVTWKGIKGPITDADGAKILSDRVGNKVVFGPLNYIAADTAHIFLRKRGGDGHVTMILDMVDGQQPTAVTMMAIAISLLGGIASGSGDPTLALKEMAQSICIHSESLMEETL